MSTLDHFRRHSKWLLVVVFVVSILSFTVLPSVYDLQGKGAAAAEEAKASVHMRGRTISDMELQRAVKLRGISRNFLNAVYVAARSKGTTPGLSPDQLNLMQQASAAQDAEAYVNYCVLSSQPGANRIVISDTIIRGLFQSLTANSFTPEEYEVVLERVGGRNEGFTIADVFEAIKQELVVQNVQSGMVFGAVTLASPHERFETFLRTRRRAEIEAIAVPVDDFLSKIPEPSDAELTAFYQAHKEETAEPRGVDGVMLETPDVGFKRPFRAAFEYLQADVATLIAAEKAVIKSEDVAKFYEENKKQRYLKTPEPKLPNLMPGLGGAAPEGAGTVNQGTVNQGTLGAETGITPPNLFDTPSPPSTGETPDGSGSTQTAPPESGASDSPSPPPTEDAAPPASTSRDGAAEQSSVEQSSTEQSTGQNAPPAADSPPLDSPALDTAPAPAEAPAPSTTEPGPATGTAPENAPPTSSIQPALLRQYAGIAAEGPFNGLVSFMQAESASGSQPASDSAAQGAEAPPATEPTTTEPTTTEPAAAEPSAPATEAAKPSTDPADPSSEPAATPDSSAPASAESGVNTPASDVPPASVAPAGDAAPSAAQDAAAAAGDEYKPLEEVQDQIRETLARQAVNQRLKETTEKVISAMDKYKDDEALYEVAKEEGQSSAKAPSLPNWQQLVDGSGFTLQRTPLMSARQFGRETEVGKSINLIQDPNSSLGFRTITMAEMMFRQEPTPLRRVLQASTMDQQYQFVCWKVEDSASHTPPLAEIREEVIKAWKRVKARPLALDRAKEIAAQAAGRSLKDAFGATPGMTVITPEAFSWQTIGMAAMDPTAAIRPRQSLPKELPNVGPDFMSALFNLEPGQTVAAENHPKTVAYALYLKSYVGGENVLRDSFSTEPRFRDRAIYDGIKDRLMSDYMDQLYASVKLDRKQVMESIMKRFGQANTR